MGTRIPSSVAGIYQYSVNGKYCFAIRIGKRQFMRNAPTIEKAVEDRDIYLWAKQRLREERNKRKGKRLGIVVDDNDILKISNWYVDNSGYIRGTKGGYFFLHHKILPKKVGFDVDHINRNRLDNRTCNLRYATRSQNAMNSKLRSNNMSGATGIYWHKQNRKWVAEVKSKGKNIYLGQFKDIELAIEARDKKAKELHKEFFYKGVGNE